MDSRINKYVPITDKVFAIQHIGGEHKCTLAAFKSFPGVDSVVIGEYGELHIITKGKTTSPLTVHLSDFLIKKGDKIHVLTVTEFHKNYIRV
jgi:hypothetical protein